MFMMKVFDCFSCWQTVFGVECSAAAAQTAVPLTTSSSGISATMGVNAAALDVGAAATFVQ